MKDSCDQIAWTKMTVFFVPKFSYVPPKGQDYDLLICDDKKSI